MIHSHEFNRIFQFAREFVGKPVLQVINGLNVLEITAIKYGCVFSYDVDERDGTIIAVHVKENKKS